MYALLLILACDSSELPPPPTSLPVVEAPAAPKLDGSVLFRQGRYKEAVEVLQKELAAGGQDAATQAALWERLELAALRSGKAGDVLDRLTADTALQQAAPFGLVKGSLALAAGRPADAIAVATGLRGSSPGDAAWLIVTAVAAGGAAPEVLSAEEAALIGWLQNPKATLEPSGAGMEGWRLALWRGHQRLMRGDRAGALEEAGKAEMAGGRAKQEAALLRVQALSSSEEVWYALEGLKAVSGEDAVGAAHVLNLGVDRVMGNWKGAEVLALAGDLRKAAEADKNPDAAARFGVVQAKVLLRTGHPLQAKDALAAALEMDGLKASASWTQALISGVLGDVAGVDAAAANLTEPRKTAALDLARVMRGERLSLPSAGLLAPGMSGGEAAFQALIGAGWMADPRPARQAALQIATQNNETDLKIWAELALDRRRFSLTDTPAAQAEGAARTFLSGGNPGAFPTDAHPDAAAWQALVKREAVTTGAGVAAWSRARAALAEGDLVTTVREYGTVSIAVPWWRTGPWEPLLGLEGPTPEEMSVVESGLLKGASDPLPMAVLLHGWSHRVNSARQTWSVGASPLPPGTLALKREAVWDAQAAHRAATVAWIAGKGAAPVDTRTALAVAEEQAGLTNFQTPSVASLRSGLTKGAMISMRSLSGGRSDGKDGGMEVLLLTESKSVIFNVSGQTVADMAQLISQLPTAPGSALGNRVREQIIDPHMDVLLGIGRYFVVGTGVMGALPLSAMPEQQDAQRYLMEIRSVGHYNTFEQLIPGNDPPKNYSFDMLAFCSSPAEADAIRRVFPNGSIYLPEQATLALWREKAPQAHFIHIGRLPEVGTGLKLTDGILSFGELASTPYAASAAYLWSNGAVAALTRGMLLKRAGINEVLVQGWGKALSYDEHFLGYWWELQLGQGLAGRAMSEARPRALKEEDDNVRIRPEIWGGYYAMGRF